MTAQTGDIFKVDGIDGLKSYTIFTEPLEAYLKSLKPRIKFSPANSGLWRGYRATWQLDKDDRLMLIDFQGHFMNNTAEGVQYLFPGQTQVFAFWFTGVLKINVGKLVKYNHRGYESIFEGSVEVHCEDGIATHLVNHIPCYIE